MKPSGAYVQLLKTLRIERLLTPQKLKIAVNKEEFKFSLSSPTATLEQALAALKKQLLLAYLWGGGHDSGSPHS